MAEDALNEQLEKAQAYIVDRRRLLDDKFCLLYTSDAADE